MSKRVFHSDLSVSPDLERLLERAKGHVVNPSEYRLQAISFAYGNSMGNPRVTYDSVVRAYDGIHPLRVDS